MGFKIGRAAFLAIGLMSAGAVHANLSCIEIGQFVEGVAQARDRGQSQSRLSSIVQEDNSFTESEKKMLKQYIEQVFKNADVPPKALSNMAIDSCYKSQSKK